MKAKYLSTLSPLIIAMLALPGTASANSAKLINPSNGHTYQRFDANVTWNTAKNSCANLGGHLVTVTSAAEQDWIKNKLPGVSWIGATDQVSEGTWEWITGETWSYSNWDAGQPDDGALGQDFALIVVLDGGVIVWDDNGGPNNPGAAYPYICEWDTQQNDYSAVNAIPDVNGDGVSDQALLKFRANVHYLLVINGKTGTNIKQVTLGNAVAVTPVSMTVVDDANGNGYKEISVLIKKADGRQVLQLRDSSTLSTVKTILLPQ